MSVSAKSKTFEFWSISLWEGIIVFIVFIILFLIPIFYTSELQKFWGIVIRLYFPILVLCTFGYVKLRSRKLIIEVLKFRKFYKLLIFKTSPYPPPRAGLLHRVTIV